MSADHFEGKSVKAHLQEARKRGSIASAEIHGIELSGALAAGADSGKEMALFLVVLGVGLNHLQLYLPLFALAWGVWKVGRSALLGYSRMERLHRLIEEERWEIEHHRGQEKLELREMYASKGMQGKLLDEVVEVLMADDDRLLRVMLEEELGLTLGAYEHPLKQAWGALVGVVGSALICLLGLWAFALPGLVGGAAIAIGVTSYLTSKREKNRVVNHIIWNLATAMLATGVLWFSAKIFIRH